jgi:tetratricopeptide (TPR) repeat protein
MHRLVTAITALEAGLASSTGNAAGYNELAALKLAAGDAAGAIAAYEQCLALAGPSAALCNNLGTALIKAARFDEAITILESALALQPGYPRALVNLGKALLEIGRSDEALAHLQEVLAGNPNYVPALVNVGDALAATGAFAAAGQALERAVQLDPGRIEARTTLGVVRLQAGDVPAALDALRAAVALAPDHADANANLAHALFVCGDWEAAWPHFEHRFRRHAQRAKLRPPAGMPRWDGRSPPGQNVWLMGEQGLGDQLQFARYSKSLFDSGVGCVLACDPRLVSLLSYANLGPRIVSLETGTAVSGACWFPLMSLPLWHRTRPDTVPAAAGYLAADPQRIERWRARIPTGGLRVALAWAGNLHMETGRYAGRSPPLAALAPLMDLPDVRFISLQQGPGQDQIHALPFGRSILCLEDLDSGPDAFLDSAAVLQCVDLLVTSDTAIAHLAGGLGVPTWLCLMHEPDWRWMRQGETTPWYTSMRLFRQPSPGDWPAVYGKVAGALRDFSVKTTREPGIKSSRSRAG